MAARDAGGRLLDGRAMVVPAGGARQTCPGGRARDATCAGRAPTIWHSRRWTGSPRPRAAIRSWCRSRTSTRAGSGWCRAGRAGRPPTGCGCCTGTAPTASSTPRCGPTTRRNASTSPAWMGASTDRAVAASGSSGSWDRDVSRDSAAGAIRWLYSGADLHGEDGAPQRIRGLTWDTADRWQSPPAGWCAATRSTRTPIPE
jgi:hypothetical protein